MPAYIIWLIVGVALVIGEMLLPSFFLLSFGLGAVAAATAAYLDASATWQWRIFLVASAVLVLATRRFARRIQPGRPLPTNLDEFMGETAVVVRRIDPVANTGVVRVKKEEWRADAPEAIEEGALVEVVGAEGAHLKVKRKNA